MPLVPCPGRGESRRNPVGAGDIIGETTTTRTTGAQVERTVKGKKDRLRGARRRKRKKEGKENDDDEDEDEDEDDEDDEDDDKVSRRGKWYIGTVTKTFSVIRCPVSRRTYVGARSGCCWWWPTVQGREKKRGERRRGSCAPHGPVVCWPVVITRREADPSDCAVGVFGEK